MAKSLELFVDRLRFLLDPLHQSKESDGELLARWAGARDGRAFAALVGRHGGLVWRVSRSVLSRPEDVEDIYQATFLVLARKSASLRNRSSLAGWLYQTALRLARKSRTASTRRLRREEQAGHTRSADPLEEISVREAHAILAQELEKLAKVYREPILLCLYEGITQDDAARRLGCSLSTLKRRLEKGRDLLSSRLTKRGLAPAGALALTLCTQARVPAQLIQQTLTAAAKFAAGESLSTSAALLATSLLRTVMVKKLLTCFTLTVALGGLTFATTFGNIFPSPLYSGERGRGEGENRAAIQPPSPKPQDRGLLEPQEDPKRPEEKQPQVILSASGKVVDEKGKAIVGAKVYLREMAVLRERALLQQKDYTDILATTTTDAGGKFAFKEIATEPMQISPSNFYKHPWDLVIISDGRGVAWHNFKTRMEEDVTIVMGPETSIRGQLLDSNGKPAAGVRVHVNSIREITDPDPQKRVAPASAWGLQLFMSQVPLATVTGADGRFVLSGLPKGMTIALQNKNDERFARNYFQCATIGKLGIDLLNAPPTVPAENKLLANDFTVTLEPNGSIQGRVTFRDTEKPVVGARVVLGILATITDSNGHYSFQGVHSRKWSIYVDPPEGSDYLPESGEVIFEAGKFAREKDFVLERGAVITGQLRDKETGQIFRVPYLSITYQSEGDKSKYSHARTKMDGSFRIVVAPGKGKLYTFDSVPGAIPRDDSRPNGPSPSQLIEIKLGETQTGKDFLFLRGLAIHGRVFDQEGKPLANAVFQGATDQLASGADGSFVLQGLSREHKSNFLVLHAGRGLGAKLTIDPDRDANAVVLIKLGSTQTLKASVVDENQKPVANARVSLQANIKTRESAGSFSYRILSVCGPVFTNDAGKFTLPNLVADGSYTINAAAPGYASATGSFMVEAGKDPEVADLVLLSNRLTVGGVVYDLKGNPVQGVQVVLIARNPALADNHSHMNTDKDGKFHFHGLAKGDYRLIVNLWKKTGELDKDGRPVSKLEAGTEQRVEAGEENLNIVLAVPQENKKEK